MLPDSRIASLAFLTSLIGHSLILGIPSIPCSFRADEIREQKVNLQVIIEKPELIPDIKQLAEQLKIKEIKPSLEKLVPQDNESAEEPLSENIVPDEPVQVLHPQEEAVLRYQDMVKRNIQEAKRYPDWAKKQGFEGITYIAFSLLGNGEVKNVRIIQSSGFAILDKEAIATVNRASPFEPIPAEFNCPMLAMEVTLVFQIK